MTITSYSIVRGLLCSYEDVYNMLVEKKLTDKIKESEREDQLVDLMFRLQHREVGQGLFHRLFVQIVPHDQAEAFRRADLIGQDTAVIIGVKLGEFSTDLPVYRPSVIDSKFAQLVWAWEPLEGTVLHRRAFSDGQQSEFVIADDCGCCS